MVLLADLHEDRARETLATIEEGGVASTIEVDVTVEEDASIASLRRPSNATAESTCWSTTWASPSVGRCWMLHLRSGTG